MTSVLALALLAGCGSSGARGDAPAMTSSTAKAFWKQYSARNNAAIIEAGPPSYDGSAFAGVDTGATLLLDLSAARIRKLEKLPSGAPFSEIVQAVYSPTADQGFALNLVHSSTHPDGPPAFKSLVGSGRSFRNEIDVKYTNGVLPTALAPGHASTADTDDVARVERVLGSIRDYWRTGQEPAGVDLDDMAHLPFMDTRRALLGHPHIEDRVTVGGPFITLGKGGAARVVRVRGGLLALAAYRVEERIVASDGAVLRTKNLGRLVSGEPLVKRSDIRYAVELAVSVPDRGGATVLGDVEFPLL